MNVWPWAKGEKKYVGEYDIDEYSWSVLVQYFFFNWFLPDWANVCRFLGADETQYASITRKICISSSYVVSGSVMNHRNASHHLKNENFLTILIFIFL